MNQACIGQLDVTVVVFAQDAPDRPRHILQAQRNLKHSSFDVLQYSISGALQIPQQVAAFCDYGFAGDQWTSNFGDAIDAGLVKPFTPVQ